MDLHRQTFRLGPRVPIFNIEVMPSAQVLDEVQRLPLEDNPSFTPSRVMARAASGTEVSNSATCTAGTADLCEKPASSVPLTVPIVLGVAIPLIAAVGVLLYLHRRSTLRLRKEDNDPHASLDFGMGEGKKRKSAFFGGKEKDPKHRAQLSMDMNLSSPYLLPPQIQGSRDSLHSLARSLKKDGDPYSSVDDVASIRSGHPGVQRKNTDGLSIYTASTVRDSSPKSPYNPTLRQNSFRQSMNSLPGSPLAVSHRANPFETHALHEDVLTRMPSPPAPAKVLSAHSPVNPAPHTRKSPVHGDAARSSVKLDQEHLVMPGASHIQEHMPVVTPKLPPLGPHSNDSKGFDFELDMQPTVVEHEVNRGPGTGVVDEQVIIHQRQSPLELGLLDPPVPEMYDSKSIDSHPNQAQHQEYQAYNPYQASNKQYDDDQYPGRGRQPSRQSNMEDRNGLGIPPQDIKRLSIGQRPLPPNEVMETEDPERRAERIRSFYKEYFEDSKRESVVPPLPNKAHQGDLQSQDTEYYEDYDKEYLSESAPFFDPDSNAFVMPYAEPVTRRAMTPPPRGRAPMGPFRGARPHAGSIGDMSLPGVHGPPRPRAESSMSGRFRGPPSMSGSAPGSRTGSRVGMNRKPMPPPAALTTLPTPSKLRDDSFSLLGSVEFAPPESFADRVAGRSQSPIGERRPYQPKVAVASPLVTTYDEMAALPSPHLLRKSSTFTGLDFAPPKIFKDADQMSDAGSIRSNRTGISMANSQAIRSGAGRVSKLPGDTVFAQAQLSDQLKPQWGMRP